MMPLITTYASGDVSGPLVVPGLNLPAGEITVIAAIAGNERHLYDFAFSHPAVTTWTLPAGGKASVENYQNPDWDLAVQLAHGTSNGGTGDLVIDLSENGVSRTAWRWCVGIWSSTGVPLEIINTGQADASTKVTSLDLGFTASGERAVLSIFDGYVLRTTSDIPNTQDMPLDTWRLGAAAWGDAGSIVNVENWAYAGAAVGAILPAGAIAGAGDGILLVGGL